MTFTPQDIINQTNQYREERGLPAMVENPLLTKAAMARAKDMSVTNNFSHSIATTTKMMVPFEFFMNKAGYQRPKEGYIGENLAADYTDATSTLSAWKKSPTHNENLLRPQFKEIGVAIVPGMYQGKPTQYVIQFFGSGNNIKVVSKTPLSTAIKTKKPIPTPLGAKMKLPKLQLGTANTTPQFIKKR